MRTSEVPNWDFRSHRHKRRETSRLRDGRDQVGEQLGGVGRAKAGDRIPTLRGAVAGDGALLIAVGGDIKEISRVLRRIVGNRIQCVIEIAEVVTSHLVRDGGEARPLRGAGTGAADIVPAGAARGAAKECSDMR